MSLLSHQLLEVLQMRLREEQARAINYQTCRDTYPPGNETRTQAYKLWMEAGAATTKAFAEWKQALTLETQDRGNRK